ncbi:hypothetical protein RJ640_010578 [Escallonia rubra]|uniref:Heat shock protein 70 n=1 Tax=Escallonia rubra TaxID=112253 RepID=A0AA88QUX2_9ASTE|nr:hypothetical protein RJ640_010578 [Escallonia rubra]
MEGGKPVIITNAEGQRTTPSVVAWTKNGDRLVPASKILKETCKYIKRLQGEVEDISERLSQLLASMDNSGVDTDFLRRLLQQ